MSFIDINLKKITRKKWGGCKVKNLIRILSLSLLLLFLATSCDMLDEILGDGGDYGDLRVQYLVANYQNGTVQLSWDTIDGADSYEIWFSENEYNNYNHVDTVYGNSYTHNYGFQSDRYYYYKIRIMDYNGTLHDYSNHVFVYIDYGGSDTVENL